MSNPDSTFEELIAKNQHLIHKICHIYAGTEAAREDLFQEITIQLWKSFSTFQYRSEFSTWLYRVALNTAITQKRKDNRKPVSVSLSNMEFDMGIEGATNTDDDDIMALRQAIRQLKAIDKAVILLYLEEKSYQEIATIIGITPKNVGVKIVRIKAKLLKILKPVHEKHE